MNNFLPELEQDPFDPEEFVERLAWRSTEGKFDPETFNPQLLQESFELGIGELKSIYDTHLQKCDRLEMVLKEEEKKHWIRVSQLQENCKDSVTAFQQLNSHLEQVGTKVVYLGEQLEGVNLPRSRAVEAHKLMKYFGEFLSPAVVPPNDPNRLFEEADMIQKLYMLANDLPQEAKYEKAKEKIFKKYDMIEKDLIEDFVSAQLKTGEPDKQRMRDIAGIMSHFKGYGECIDAFIEHSQNGIFLNDRIFLDAYPICQKSQSLVKEVFPTVEQQDKVMSRFILNLYTLKIGEYVKTILTDAKDHEKFLTKLQDMYTKTTKLSDRLTQNKMLGANASFLSNCTRGIFGRYLDPMKNSYFDIEKKTLEQKCDLILKRYYDSKNHQKRNIPQGTMHDLKRDLQAKIGKANINIANINISMAGLENYGSETFLSEEVAINILQETKLALHRCSLLSRPVDLPSNAKDIFLLQLKYLINEHIDYALELALYAIPPNEPKNEPQVHFFEVVRQTNAVCHLLEKQFVDSVIPIVNSASHRSECIRLKKESFDNMEMRLNMGLDRTVNAIIGWIKCILQKEQKKNEFTPETDNIDMLQTSACKKVVKFMTMCITRIKDSIDGKNVETLLKELGIRYHRLIFDHMIQYQVSSVGAMIMICDVNEYRKCATKMDVPILNTLFETLHDLCNLLVVPTENLKQISSGERLKDLDKSVINSVIQMRTDFKTAKLNLTYK